MNTTRRRAATRAELADPADLAALLPGWARHLRAANLSPGTIESYGGVGASLLAYLREHGMPTRAHGIARAHQAYLADMLDRLALATVAERYRSLQQLWRWLVEDGEINVSHVVGSAATLISMFVTVHGTWALLIAGRGRNRGVHGD